MHSKSIIPVSNTPATAVEGAMSLSPPENPRSKENGRLFAVHRRPRAGI